MKKILFPLICCLVWHSAQARIIIKTVSGQHATAFAAGFNGHTVKTINPLGLQVAEAPAGVSDAQWLKILKANPAVQYAEIDGKAHTAGRARVASGTNDPYYGNEWHLFKVNAPQAWAYAAASPPVTVAVLDTGVSAVADLAGNLVGGGWNFVNNSAQTSDWAGHGTAVAGTLGAICNNGIGVAGSACNIRILPIVVADQNESADWLAIADGITYAVNHGARIINVSMEDVANSQAVQDAAQYATIHGAIVNLAAGNYGRQETYAPNSNLVVVSATDASDNLASFSSYGNFVTLSAPGDNIYTTMTDGSTGIWYGTSFSTPIVSAIEAMMLEVNPNLSPAAMKSILETTAVDLGSPGWDPQFGYGRVDAGAAVAKAAAMAGAQTPTTTPPSGGQTGLPDFSFVTPTAGSQVSSNQTVAIQVTNNDPLSRVQFVVDGQLLNDYSGQNFYSYRIVWHNMAAGWHVLWIKVYDMNGNWRWRQERVWH